VRSDASVESGRISRLSQYFEPSPIDHTPTVPEVGRLLVPSVLPACHCAGSAVESNQILARIEFPLLVGLTSSRKRYHWPGCGTTPVIGCAQVGLVPWAESSNGLVFSHVGRRSGQHAVARQVGHREQRIVFTEAVVGARVPPAGHGRSGCERLEVLGATRSR